jgi:hypothetical protein
MHTSISGSRDSHPCCFWLCLSSQPKSPKDLEFMSLNFIYYLLFYLGNKKDVDWGSFGLLVCGLMTSAICPQRYFDLKLGQFEQLEHALTQHGTVTVQNVAAWKRASISAKTVQFSIEMKFHAGRGPANFVPHENPTRATLLHKWRKLDAIRVGT